MNIPITRRRFIGRASGVALGGAAILSGAFPLGLLGSVAAHLPATSDVNGDDYRALVCLFLAGGNDAYNMLMPCGAEHADYLAMRGGLHHDLKNPSGLALAQEEILSLGNPGMLLGLHPSLRGLHSLYARGKLALVANVGTLVERITKAEYHASEPPCPAGLFGHADQRQPWRDAFLTASGGGWSDLATGHAARVLDAHARGNSPLTTGRGGLLVTKFPGETGYRAAPDYLPEADPARGLAAQLKAIVHAVAGRAAEGAQRQTFCVNFGGWDHHDALIPSHAQMLDIVSRCLVSFYAALEEIGAHEKVTLFTASEFGRTLASNGSGSDHGWGGHHFVLGSAVKGGVVYGHYPALVPEGPSIVTSRGVTIPTLSVEEYYAELALWLGVARDRLSAVLPRIGYFYTPGLDRPVGFMKT